MRLFLPEKGWHVALKKSLCEEYADINDEWQREGANTNIWEEPENEAILNDDYDIAKWLGRPELKWVKEAWFWTSDDPVSFPEDAMGEEVEVCMGHSLVYHDYDRAIIDLARVHAPAARLVYLALYGPESARPLARAVLDGDRAAFGPLGDALEEAGHPDAKEIRKLAKEEKKQKPQGGRGKPLPTAPASAPAKAKGAKSAKADKPAKPVATSSPGIMRVAEGMQDLVVVGGYPCAGKSSLVQPLVQAGYVRLNRDEAGGTLDALHKRIVPLLEQGRSIVLDNLYATRAGRQAVADSLGDYNGDFLFRFVHLETSIDDAMFNACLRMVQKYGRVLHPEDMKKAPYKDDPSMFPVAVLYKYRNDFEEPDNKEQFEAIERVPFVRQYPAEWKNKAAIFDFDGTLRTHEGKEKYPCKPSEVRAMKERAGKLRELRKQDCLLLGASNQSGVAKGTLSAADAQACFAETVKQLGVPFEEVLFCPHKVPPLTCYCRKPNPGMGVELIVKYKLDPKQCIYVGDQGTDRSFAQKCGFEYADQAEFFANV